MSDAPLRQQQLPYRATNMQHSHQGIQSKDDKLASDEVEGSNFRNCFSSVMADDKYGSNASHMSAISFPSTLRSSPAKHSPNDTATIALHPFVVVLW